MNFRLPNFALGTLGALIASFAPTTAIAEPYYLEVSPADQISSMPSKTQSPRTRRQSIL